MAAVPTEDPQPAPVDPATPASGPVNPPPGAPVGRPSRAGFLRRLGVGTNVTVQMILLAFILLAVNGYAFKHYHRFDFSRDRKYALSDVTKRLLASLTKPVKIIVFMEGKDLLQADAANLVDEYRATNPKLVSIEIVDPLVNVGRAKEIQTKYKLAQQENVVILDCEGRNKIISDDKMADLDTSGVQFGQPPTIAAFTGEQAVTAGLLEVIEGKKNNVYYVQGHGEGAIGTGKPLETLGKVFDNQHLSVADVNLLNVQTLPSDTSALLIFGPHIDFSDREMQVLQDYWTKGGRVFLLLDPDYATPHLADFLARLGVKPDDNRVLTTRDLGNVTGIIRDVYTNIVGNTPIAKQLAGFNIGLVGATQSLTLTPEQVASVGTKVAPLLEAFKGYWGEVDYKDTETTGVYFDKGKDKDKDLYVAATVEKGAVADQRVQTNAARLIVAGNSHFFENEGISEQSANFFVGGVNWLLERDALIGVAPKTIKRFTLGIPEEQIRTLLGLMVFAIPGLCGLAGVLVWWRRRA